MQKTKQKNQVAFHKCLLKPSRQILGRIVLSLESILGNSLLMPFVCVCLFTSQKALRAKEYECFVMKIQRLENLCRALQEERKELYKKIREAKMSEKEEQGQHTSDEEPESTVSEDKETDAEEANSVQNSIKNLSTVFTILHHPESTLDQTEERQPSVIGPQDESDITPQQPQLALPNPPAASGSPEPPVGSQDGANVVCEAASVSTASCTSAGAELQSQGFPAGNLLDQKLQKPEAKASDQAPEQGSLDVVETTVTASPSPESEGVPAVVPGSEPGKQPPPAVTEIPPGPSTGLPTEASLDGVD